MKPTAKQVAHLAGVSIAAVSRAFAPGAPLEAAKRQRILAAAEEIGYVSPARRTAQAIAAGTVTLVAGDLLNPFYPTVLDALAKQLQASHRKLLVYALAADADVDAITPQILASRPAAVVVTSATLTSGMVRACRQHRIKVVLLNRIQRDIRTSAVSCDNYQGGRDIARLLIDRGSRRIAFIGGIANTSTHAERARGFRDVLVEAGRSVHAEASGGFAYGQAYKAGLAMLGASDPPDAVFCCNDIMAIALLDAARERGVRVPDDLAVAGFDDIPMANWNAYRLTTVRQPVERMVEEALALIDDATSRPSAGGTIRIVPGEVIVRGTT